MIDSLVEPIRALAVYVDALPASIAFRESIYISPYTTVTHVVSVGAFAGLICAEPMAVAVSSGATVRC